MRLEITKDSLIDAIQHVLKAVSTNNPIAILTGIHIEATTKGLIVTASNSSMKIQYTIAQDDRCMKVQRAGGIVVPARYFHEVIRKLDAGAITIEQLEPFILTIVSGHSRIRLSGMDPAEFPVTTTSSTSLLKLSVNNATLKTSIKQVAAAASTSETRPVLTGIHLVCQNEWLSLAATDGIRLASFSIPMDRQADLDADIIIPSRNLMEVARLLDEETARTEIEIGHHYICFRVGQVQLQSVLLEGVYPLIKNFIPTSYLTEIVVDTSLFLRAVERATVFASESVIRIAAAANQLDLLSRTAEIGEVHEAIPLQQISGDPFEIAVNGKFLIDLLRFMDSGYLRLRFTGQRSPIMIHPADDWSSALFLITPVRTTGQGVTTNERA
ncbi:DNA polymerase III subunit beta [Paenibacillus lupini]|uniref:DNA polymerase III subunit beta n=1 Tax=Paenibacillus lupini TaxID=1450204 RepID=UPI001423DA48|nr:DNA polymerase III subunit beta [Paenibacillus lupini]NIK26066.1 DNA polymerase-3 subunit beta [Paenibacillus lupini]